MPSSDKPMNWAQRKSIVLLKNGDAAPILPVQDGPGLRGGHAQRQPPNMEKSSPTWLTPTWCCCAPRRPSSRDGNFLEQRFHAGSLEFKQPEKDRILAILAAKPAIVAIYLDRPAVIPRSRHRAPRFGEFGYGDEALLDVVFGRFCTVRQPRPFELPSSMAAVEVQKPDLPHDSESPLSPVRARPHLLNAIREQRQVNCRTTRALRYTAHKPSIALGR